MQQLTAPPRDTFTDAQIMALLTKVENPVLDFGVELLAADGGAQQASTGQPVVVEDLSGVFRQNGSSVSRKNYATTHGACTLLLDQPLAWGVDLVRPYAVLGHSSIGTARFNLGCYLVTSPDQPLQFASTYTVTGFDPLVFLDVPIGASYSVRKGSNVLAAVANVIDAAGFAWQGVLIADQSRNDAVTANDMVWPLASDTIYTYLTVINELLASIGYRGLWCDENGNYRADRYIPLARCAGGM